MFIRDATPDDAVACAEVYAPYVRDTTISFEAEPPSAADFAARMAASAQRHAWLVVADASGTVFGYAYGGPMNPRAAYRWSCEVSIYLAPGRGGAGAGRTLYEALFARLVSRGYRTAVAGLALPNPASEALHRATGFELVGVYRRVGWKHGAWHDVAWWQRPLVAAEKFDAGHPPPEPH